MNNVLLYAELIKRVYEIDDGAGEFLNTKAPEIKRFCFDDDLATCFDWDKSPQGFDYWYNIYKRLNDKPKYKNKEYEYEDLVNRVAKINKSAAEYMKTDALQHETFTFSGTLSTCFMWYRTPQGHRYWSDIYKKLSERS